MKIQPFLFRVMSSIITGALICIIYFFIVSNIFSDLYLADLKYIKLFIESKEWYLNLFLFFVLGEVFATIWEFFVMDINYNIFGDLSDKDNKYHELIKPPINGFVASLIFPIFLLKIFLVTKLIDVSQFNNDGNVVYWSEFSKNVIQSPNSNFPLSELYYNMHRIFGGLSLLFLIISIIILFKNPSLKLFGIFISIYILSFYICHKYREIGNRFIKNF